MEGTDYVKELQDLATQLNCSLLASNVLEAPDFVTASGSGKPERHHYGSGGLVKHTWEVTMLVQQSLHFLITKAHPDGTITPKVYQKAFLASLFHDYGKLRDYHVYEVVPTNKYQANEAVYTRDHAYKIGHLTRSAIFWETCATKAGYPKDDTEEITHAILAHHGLKEWGSPVNPQTLIAWVLHTCDLMSARADEYS